MARVAGAGLIPALATAAVLALSSCGGSSSEAQTAASTTGSTADESPSGNTAGGQSQALSPAEKEQEEAAAKVREASAEGDSSSGEGKHGPRIAQPKGEPEPEATPGQEANSAVANIALSSPALQASGSAQVLSAAYTCDGNDSWPQLDWHGVPSGTAELVLFAMNIQPVNEQIFFDWAVAGLDPSLSGLDAGQLPRGAVMGKNSFGRSGYSICPPRGQGETYMFVLYALPKALGSKQGFDPLALREEAIRLSGNAGLMAASYLRT